MTGNYILVIRWSGYETSIQEYATLEELKENLKKSGACGNEYFVAKVLATDKSVIDNIKE